MELELEQLTPYLPYGLSFIDKYERKQGAKLLTGICGNTIYYENDNKWTTIDCVQPILKSLDHYKDIVSDAMNDLNSDLSTQMALCDLANRKIGLAQLSYIDALYCFSEHIDIFRLIDAGLAVNHKELTS